MSSEADGLLWLAPGLIDAVRRDDQPSNQQQRAMERVIIGGYTAGRGVGAVCKVQQDTPALVYGVLAGAQALTPREDDRRVFARFNVVSERVVLRPGGVATEEGKL